jgi:hypothetical protein
MMAAVMCMAEMSASPSWMPLSQMILSTSLVIGMISLRFFV